MKYILFTLIFLLLVVFDGCISKVQDNQPQNQPPQVIIQKEVLPQPIVIREIPRTVIVKPAKPPHYIPPSCSPGKDCKPKGGGVFVGVGPGGVHVDVK